MTRDGDHPPPPPHGHRAAAGRGHCGGRAGRGRQAGDQELPAEDDEEEEVQQRDGGPGPG